MKSFERTAGLACLFLLLSPVAVAQEKSDSQEKPAPVTLRIQIVLNEFDGNKKITSLPYEGMAVTQNPTRSHVSIRSGARVPVAQESKDSKYTYVDVGTNIDCFVRQSSNGSYGIEVNLERSSIVPESSAPTSAQANSLPGATSYLLPLLHQFRSSFEMVLRDGQTAQGSAATDPLTGHVWKTEVTLNVLK